MYRFILSILLVNFAGFSAQSQMPGEEHLTDQGAVTIVAKNYYLLSLLAADKAAARLIKKDTALTSLLKNRYQHIAASIQDCKGTPACIVPGLQFSDSEIQVVGGRFSELCTPGNALSELAKRLVHSHCYFQFEKLSPKALLVKAWEQDASGINFAIDVYAAGKKPNYPAIDSISFNVNDPRYSSLLYNAVSALSEQRADTDLFFSPSLNAALLFLEINERNNAADYEPLSQRENKNSVSRINNIKWSRYKYSLILVPGAGPDDPMVPLSAEGMIRCRLAASAYNKGMAPFILVSGGKVHPYKTKYCEAIEMKRYLVENLHVPDNAIFIDPHARHTTTNLRNAARLIYRSHLPFSKPAISCTTRGQSNMIETSLPARCIKELRELPYRNGNRLSETMFEFYPLIYALQINPLEPMDP